MVLTNPVAVLQDLIRIPSPNPPGDARAIATYIADFMRACGCETHEYAPPNKPEAVSVVSILRGKHDGQTVMLHAHIDTVPIATDEAGRWSVDPYSATIRDGKIYGKGSIDDKAPMASMLVTLAHAAAHQDQLYGTLIVVGAAEEETGGKLGTKWLADSGLLPTCDFIVVGEQTANHVANAHKGVLRATVRATGKSVHATNPDRGINAIAIMAHAILALETYHHQLATRVHPTVGVPTCNVGVITGGSTANAVPDSATVYLDRRMIPHENPESVQQELENVIASVDLSAYGADATLTVGDYQVSNWFASTVDSPLSQTFLACVQARLKESPGPIGYLPGSDAKHLVGVTRGEMIIFGPGSYEVAHAFDEHTNISDLEDTTAILKDFIDRVMLNGGIS